MSGLMAEIDEHLDEDELDPEKVKAFKARVEALLAESRYLAALQANEALVHLHADLRRPLGRL
jgi:hypothetical protein